MLQDASVTQAKLGVNVVGNGPAFSAYPSAAQSGVANNTWTKVTLDTEEFDTNSNFASSRFTPTVAGYYQINASAYMSSGTGGLGELALYKNGVLYKGGSNIATISANTIVTVNSLVYFNGTTDYLELFFIQTTGGPQTIASTPAYTFMNGFLARSA